jgi:hypothetical protein
MRGQWSERSARRGKPRSLDLICERGIEGRRSTLASPASLSLYSGTTSVCGTSLSVMFISTARAGMLVRFWLRWMVPRGT